MNRRSLLLFTILVALVVLSIAFVPGLLAKPVTTPYIEATVIRVVDGDTFEAVFNKKTEKVRLIGVDTPETVKPGVKPQPYGKEASVFTKKQLEKKKVWLELDVQQRDKYGRLLAYVWQKHPGDKGAVMFNRTLVDQGYAQIMTIPPNVKYQKDFLKLQQAAREKGRGLWAQKFNQAAPAAPQKTVTQTKPPAQTMPVASAYIGNSNTKKFHKVSCSSVAKMNSSNKVAIKTRDEAIKSGYVPCKICNP